MTKKIIIVCVLLVTFISCNKKESKDQLAGVWKLSKIVVDTPLDIHNSGEASTVLFDAKEDNDLAKSELIFNNSTSGSMFLTETWTFMTYSEKENMKFAVMGSISDDIEAIPISYAINNNEGTISIDNVVSELIKEEDTLLIKVRNGFEAKDIETLETTVSQDLTYVFYKG